MEDSTLLKIWAMSSIVVLWIVNALTFKVDGMLLTTIAGIIGGLAGYEVGRSKSKQQEVESNE